jgi:glutamate racemase
MLPPDITVVSQGEIVADSLSAYLLRHPEMETRLSKGSSLEFCTTGDPESFKHAAGAFWGEGVGEVELVSLRLEG